MKWREVLKSNYETVTVQSYGYTEGRIISHFEPFAHKKDIVFNIVRDGRWSNLENDTFFIDENYNDLDFEERDGELYLDDPELFCSD